MKRYLPYIIAAIVVFLLGSLIVSSNHANPKRWDERITLRQKDKIPYGTSAAKSLLPSLFPAATVYYNKTEPVDWDSFGMEDPDQAVILMADVFNADEEELSRLFSFVKKGNYLFIIARSFSFDAVESFGFSYNETSLGTFMGMADDSLRIKLEPPFFASDSVFVYPGRKYESYFYSVDTAHTRILGRTADGRPNFLQMKAGDGRVYIHIAPLAFSNYFVLHKKNVEYLANAFSVIPPSVSKILWNEYYLTKPRGNSKDPNWLGVLMRYPSFKWGLLTGIATLILFAFLSMRRRQRMIPEYQRPKNDSLDFIKTLGRLYYDQKDHSNLAKKMATYFLDHVRSRYKIATQQLDETFLRSVLHKTGYPSEELKSIVDSINYIQSDAPLTEEGLSAFHRQLEKFYQNT